MKKAEKKMFVSLMVLTALFGVFHAAAFAAGAIAATVDISAFTLKDGGVCKGGKSLDYKAIEVPSEIGGPIRYWTILGPRVDDIVTESETGVWFFASGGECLTFVPLDSEDYCQDAVFSPDGEKFVLVTGNGLRPEVTFEVYGGGTEKLAELPGIRGGPVWADPVRLVYTRIDDTRDFEEGVSPYGWTFGWRVSVVMYDTAAKEATVLKEATDTQNFWLSEITEDGNAVTVREESVKSEKDWGDDEKTKTRKIRVEIPAAAFAAAAAKVAAFPNGEGLEEFLSGADGLKINRVKRANDFDDTAILVVPLLEDCSIEVYETEMNENFEAVPKRGNPGDVIAEGAPGYGLLFWRRVPEGIPDVVVILHTGDGERSWSPTFSGFDGSLVTNDYFIPFGEPNGAESN